jgi:hypothetical protein
MTLSVALPSDDHQRQLYSSVGGKHNIDFVDTGMSIFFFLISSCIWYEYTSKDVYRCILEGDISNLSQDHLNIMLVYTSLPVVY